MRKIILCLTAILAGALSGCNSVNHSSLVTPSLATVQQAAVSPQVSRALQADVVRRFGGAFSHPPVEALLQETLQDLTRASGLEGLPQTVILLDTPAYNAVALPNGQLFVTRGIVALANDRAELAAALAHELGHVIAKHSAQRVVERARARADALNVARTYGDPEVTRATLAAHQQTLAAFSREMELEADRISIDLLSKAGYDPRASLRMLQGLDRMGAFYANLARVQRGQTSALASHPSTPERVVAAQKLLAGMSASGGRTDRERYLASIAGLAFGENGRGGYVRGRTFLHRGLNVAVTMPQGYVVRGFSDSVGGVKQGGKTVMMFSRMAPGVAADPEGALQRLLARSTQQVSFRPVPGGISGAMAALEGANARSRIGILVVAGKPYRLSLSSPVADPALDRDFAETITSLRTMTAQDEQIARPQVLRIVRAEGPGALARLAAQGGNSDHGQQLLLALNGLRSPADIRPGSPLKVIELGVAPASAEPAPEPLREPELAAAGL